MRLPLALILLACAPELAPPAPAPPGQAPAGAPGPPQGGQPGPPEPDRSHLPPDGIFPAVAPDADGMVPVPGGWIEAGWPRRGAKGSKAPEPDRQRGEAPPWQLGIGAGLEPQRTWVKPFRIDRTEVTRAAYREFLLATGYRPPSVEEEWYHTEDWYWDGTEYFEGTGEHPVVGVNWYDAREYCAWRGKRLPTDAEWQLAVLGPAETDRYYPWGHRYEGDRLNHGISGGEIFDDSDGYRTTSPVGSFPKGRSEFGLEDAYGNAWEWVEDSFIDDWALASSTPYEDGVTDLVAATPGQFAVVRGGSFYFDLAVRPESERTYFVRELRRKTTGMRCAASL